MFRMDQSTDQKAQQWLLGIGRREEWGVTASVLHSYGINSEFLHHFLSLQSNNHTDLQLGLYRDYLGRFILSSSGLGTEV